MKLFIKFLILTFFLYGSNVYALAIPSQLPAIKPVLQNLAIEEQLKTIRMLERLERSKQQTILRFL